CLCSCFFFFSSRRRHTRSDRDWSSDVCSSDLTIGRPRLLRRRWLCLPIGVFAGLILSGAFGNTELFWWPFLGSDFTHDALLPTFWIVVVEEVIGLFVCWMIVGQYDLYLPGPREVFFRTGRLTMGTS